MRKRNTRSAPVGRRDSGDYGSEIWCSLIATRNLLLALRDCATTKAQTPKHQEDSIPTLSMYMKLIILSVREVLGCLRNWSARRSWNSHAGRTRLSSYPSQKMLWIWTPCCWSGCDISFLHSSNVLSAFSPLMNILMNVQGPCFLMKWVSLHSSSFVEKFDWLTTEPATWTWYRHFKDKVS